MTSWDTEPDPFFTPLDADETAVTPDIPAPGWPAQADLPALLAPLAVAQDALARLDARAAAVPPALRDGLIARLAFHEAAGWLAATHAWVHPHDLALRAQTLTGGFDAALRAGTGQAALPNTLASGETAWAMDADPLAPLRDEAGIAFDERGPGFMCCQSTISATVNHLRSTHRGGHICAGWLRLDETDVV